MRSFSFWSDRGSPRFLAKSASVVDAAAGLGVCGGVGKLDAEQNNETKRK